MDSIEIQNIVKAIIQASVKPIMLDELYQAFKGYDVEDADIKAAIEKLMKIDDPVQNLKQIAGGYRYQIRVKYASWIQRAQGIEPDKLPRALTEALAIIAYKQPVSRGEIDLIRGCSTHVAVFQQLEERGWIRIVAYGGESNRAALYGTTGEFLEYFGLNSVHDLPDLTESLEVTADVI